MQIFVIIWFVLFFWIIGKGIAQFIENENSPVLTGPATIVDMRRKTHHHHHNHGHHHSHSYHVTFELENGERMLDTGAIDQVQYEAYKKSKQ